MQIGLIWKDYPIVSSKPSSMKRSEMKMFKLVIHFFVMTMSYVLGLLSFANSFQANTLSRLDIGLLNWSNGFVLIAVAFGLVFRIPDKASRAILTLVTVIYTLSLTYFLYRNANQIYSVQELAAYSFWISAFSTFCFAAIEIKNKKNVARTETFP